MPTIKINKYIKQQIAKEVKEYETDHNVKITTIELDLYDGWVIITINGNDIIRLWGLK